MCLVEVENRARETGRTLGTQHTQRRNKTDALQRTATHCITLQHIAAMNTSGKLQ